MCFELTKSDKNMGIQEHLRQNLASALTVFLVSIPLCLGVAHASGAPLFAGLLSGVVGGLVVGALSRSQLSVTGPAAGLTAVVLVSLKSLGSFELLWMATVIAGLLQIAMGWARLGMLVKFVPSAVVQGLFAAIGLILILSELRHLFGFTGDEALQWSASTHGAAAFVGVSALAAMILWDRKKPERFAKIPGALVGVTLGIVLHLIFMPMGTEFALQAEQLVRLPQEGIGEAFGLFRSGAPLARGFFSLPLFQSAVTISLVASLESLLSVDALDRLDRMGRRTPPNRELVAQGVGNMVAGGLGGLPLASVIARSTVNLTAGATSNASTVMSGGFLLIAMLVFPGALEAIPLAALSAILIRAGLVLSRPSIYAKFYKKGLSQFLPFIVTVGAVLVSDVLTGVFVGMVTSLIFILKTSYEESAFNITQAGKLKRIVLGEDASFLQKARLEDILSEVPAGWTVEIDGSKSFHIDPEIIDVLERFREEARPKNIQVVIGGISQMDKHRSELEGSMQQEYQRLLSNNAEWVREKLDEDPGFFKKRSEGQTPHFLFVGCSDSRVPVETITKSDPGNIFLHRNIANVISLSDINMLSVLQYSVEVLNVRHIVVLGHYGCGGVRAALAHRSLGLIDNWIANVKLSVKNFNAELEQFTDPAAYERRAVEVHVIQQVRNLHKTSIVQNAIKKYGFPKLHGWVYDLENGQIKDLGLDLMIERDFAPVFRYD